jgi:alkanesulfonate monooxygenase SsuD/methylene tetrahydromethanopterin reductase-like flavin-dependent oxidoreductase (luciferase family)
MELGVYTFAELRSDPEDGQAIDPAQRLRDLMEEIELADRLGLDVFGVGEHHRPDFASRRRPSSSAPPRRAPSGFA